MVYRKVQGDIFPPYTETLKSNRDCDNAVSYQVYEGEELAAEFSYHTQRVRGEEAPRFWVDGIRLSDAFADGKTMESVLQFIQYKCEALGCSALHLTLDEKNLFYRELYERYGFYLIDQVETESSHGKLSLMSVYKYPIPSSKDEIYRGYILRSERKRTRVQPG